MNNLQVGKYLTLVNVHGIEPDDDDLVLLEWDTLHQAIECARTYEYMNCEKDVFYITYEVETPVGLRFNVSHE